MANTRPRRLSSAKPRLPVKPTVGGPESAQAAVAAPVEKLPAQVAQGLMAEVATSPRDTPEAREFAAPGAQVDGGATGGVRDRREPGTGKWSLSEASRKKYGIRPEEAISWPTDTAHGALATTSLTDNVAQLLDANPGARLVINPDTGNPVRVGHHLMVAYPRAWDEEHQAEIDRQHAATEKAVHDRALPGDDFNRLNSREDREAMRDHSGLYLRSLGVGSEVMSPTAGMGYKAVVARKSVDEINAEMDRHRMGGRRPNAAHEEAAAASEARERQERNKSGTRKVWSGWRP